MRLPLPVPPDCVYRERRLYALRFVVYIRFSFFRQSSPPAYANYSNNTVHVHPADSPTSSAAPPPPPVKPVSILPTMVKTFGWQFLFGSILKLIHDVIQFISPLLLRSVTNEGRK